jgi:hypothetical protein
VALNTRLVDFFSVPVSVGSLGAPVVSFTDSVDLVDEALDGGLSSAGSIKKL